jgi:methylphosphotriester-DNA--protein-cysteine methyltransferase
MRSKTYNGSRPCGGCGSLFPADEQHFYRTSAGGLTSECRACFRARSSANQKARHHAGGIAYHLAYITRSARLRARKSRLAFDIDAEYLRALLRDQGGLCAVSGIELTFAKGKGHVPTNASIDRIDPRSGYTRENVQLVAWQVNAIKSNLDLAELARWCELIRGGLAARRPTRASPEAEERQEHVDQLDAGERHQHAADAPDE